MLLRKNGKPRLVFVTPGNNWGGIPTYVENLVLGLAKLGPQITVICGVGSPIHGGDNIHDGISILRVLKGDDPDKIRLQVFHHIKQLREVSGVDVVEFPEYGAPGIEFQRRVSDCPSVVRLHGDSELGALGNMTPVQKLVRRMFPAGPVTRQVAFERETVRLANVVTAPTQWILDQANRRGWLRERQRATVIPNPFCGFPDGAVREQIDDQEPDVVFLGRLDYRKGAPLIPEVVRRIHAKHPGVRIRLIGQSGTRKLIPGLSRRSEYYSDWIRRMIPTESNSKLEIILGAPHSQIRHLLPYGKIACFLSTWESFGYTHVEAMHCGLATVVGSEGGARELGMHGKHLLYVDRSPIYAADAIIRLIDAPIFRLALADAGKRHVDATFGSLALAEKMLEVYLRLIPSNTKSH